MKLVLLLLVPVLLWGHLSLEAFSWKGASDLMEEGQGTCYIPRVMHSFHLILLLFPLHILTSLVYENSDLFCSLPVRFFFLPPSPVSAEDDNSNIGHGIKLEKGESFYLQMS